MKKEKIKTLLDYVPLFILTICAIVLVWTTITTDAGFIWRHFVGLCFLPIILLAFRYVHKIGVLVLGLTLLLGLLGILSYSNTVTTSTLSIGKTAESQLTVFYGQPIFLLWLLIHFIVSGRHYFGIATKKYWHNILHEANESING